MASPPPYTPVGITPLQKSVLAWYLEHPNWVGGGDRNWMTSIRSLLGRRLLEGQNGAYSITDNGKAELSAYVDPIP